ncbi:hypothetical protein H5410_028314 [Solanum commersonii]|uniref:Uncharacterized protein n=1 Tax=Solanum commersonii TaxID=4109 RepID=A0A9J5Z748_SOLCO|nr:hypothetical protein H5410_028314 [Solanum commersonii]
MDFVVGLPKTRKDNIWEEDYARLYIHDLVRLHGFLYPSYRTVVLNLLPLLEVLSKGSRYELSLLRPFRISGWTSERTIKHLRICLGLVYWNLRLSFQHRYGSFWEALWGVVDPRLDGLRVGEVALLGPDLVMEALEKVRMIRKVEGGPETIKSPMPM